MCSQLVSVICSDLGGWSHTVQGNLEEIEQESGLVLTGVPISPGKEVRICCGNNQLKGTVETCVHDDVLGFFVEVRFDADSQWSEGQFTPSHLLRPASKVALAAAS
jgi:hypothetical protein